MSELTKERIEEILAKCEGDREFSVLDCPSREIVLRESAATVRALCTLALKAEKYREALKPFADVAPFLSSEWCGQGVTQEAIRRARAAYEE